MVSLRPTPRRLAIASASLGALLLAASCSWAYLLHSSSSQDRNEATQQTLTLSNDVSSSSTSIIKQDSDLLRTLSREQSFARWLALPGTDAEKLSDATGEAYLDMADIRQSFVDYARLFPAAFETLEFIDASTMTPVAMFDDGAYVPPTRLPHTVDDAQRSWIVQASQLSTGQTLVTQPYIDGDGDGEHLISLAGPLLQAGSHGVVVTTLNVSRLQEAMVSVPGSAGHAVGLVDRTDASVLATGSDEYAVSPAVARDAVQRMKLAHGSVSFERDGRIVAAVPASAASAGGLDVGWLGVVTETPLPAAGVSSMLSPGVVSLILLGLALLALALVLQLRQRRASEARAAQVRAERDRFASGMVELTDALARTSTGDLATRLNVELGDEAMTGLAASFDQTLGALRDLVSQAQTNSRLLNAAATELRATSTQQATSANQQSAVVTETTATIEELAATAVQIAENSEAVAIVAEQTLATTMEGRQAVEESVAAIESVNGQVAFIAQACEGLGEKIAEIGGILAIIDELSDQTNLLALNAAIEAARAGEHGRGFAVVASEIRRLAERSQESTVRIQSIITEISARARQTVDASSQGSYAVRAVAQQARAAADSLERIASLVDTTTSAAREISAATGQQRSASEQVVQAMAEVNASARQFAAGAKQSASSAEEIADLAVRTELSISHFVTEDAD
ncbi:MAG TPA: methyl-accepting chemotaxis protein [Actinomycetes bacterium]|nr:methyl-accepting chemotaxis protein [Actinomycetes bacterium]